MIEENEFRGLGSAEVARSASPRHRALRQSRAWGLRSPAQAGGVRVWREVLAAGVLGCALVGCGGADSGSAPIESTRIASKPFMRVLPGVPLAERLGVRTEAQEASTARQARPEVIAFAYCDMPGWTAKTPVAPFRHVNLSYEPDPRAELTVAAYEDRGGLAANVNRWRGQVGADPLSPEEIAALPKVQVLSSGQATLVEAYGPFQGMRGPRIEEGGILGAIVSNERFTLFAKFTGPKAVLVAERERFIEFLASLRPAAPGDRSGPDATGPTQPADSNLTWVTPNGWSDEAPSSRFRERTFRKGGIEMSLSLARGAVKANVNRWANELQMAPLDDAAVAALPTLPSMGTDAVLFEGVGAYRGMRDASARPDQRMLAAIVQIPDAGGTIATLKAVGPSAEVAAARGEFAALLGSLGVRGR